MAGMGLHLLYYGNETIKYSVILHLIIKVVFI